MLEISKILDPKFQILDPSFRNVNIIDRRILKNEFQNLDFHIFTYFMGSSIVDGDLTVYRRSWVFSQIKTKSQVTRKKFKCKILFRFLAVSSVKYDAFSLVKAKKWFEFGYEGVQATDACLSSTFHYRVVWCCCGFWEYRIMAIFLTRLNYW